MLQMELQIQEKVKTALGKFDLIFGNKRLDDYRTVKDYGLQPRSTVYFELRLDVSITRKTDGNFGNVSAARGCFVCKVAYQRKRR